MDWLNSQGIDSWQVAANHLWAFAVIPLIDKAKPTGTDDEKWKRLLFGTPMLLWVVGMALAGVVTWLTDGAWSFIKGDGWNLDFSGGEFTLTMTLAATIAAARNAMKTAAGKKTVKTMTVAAGLIYLVAPTPAQAGEVRGFAGWRYDDTHNLTVGVATNISGPVWNFTYGDIGRYGSTFTDMAIIIKPNARLGVGVLAGPGIDFGADLPGPAETYLDYVLGAGGFIANYEIGASVGLTGVYKYKFALDNDAVLYPNGWAASVVVNFLIP